VEVDQDLLAVVVRQELELPDIKALVVEEVEVEILLLQHLMAETVVPVSSSSPTQHKYSKNLQ
jgi:hypothetical protein